MRTIQSYKSFSSEVNENWNEELTGFEEACINEGVDLGDYVINEGEDDFLDDAWNTVKAAASKMSSIQASTEKGIAAALKAVGAAAAKKPGELGKAIAKDANIAKNSKIYIATLEKLLAQAKKNPAAYMTSDARKSLASLVGMSAGAGAAAKKAVSSSSGDIQKAVKSTWDAMKDIAPAVGTTKTAEFVSKAVSDAFKAVKGML